MPSGRKIGPEDLGGSRRIGPEDPTGSGRGSVRIDPDRRLLSYILLCLVPNLLPLTTRFAMPPMPTAKHKMPFIDTAGSTRLYSASRLLYSTNCQLDLTNCMLDYTRRSAKLMLISGS